MGQVFSCRWRRGGRYETRRTTLSELQARVGDLDAKHQAQELLISELQQEVAALRAAHGRSSASEAIAPTRASAVLRQSVSRLSQRTSRASQLWARSLMCADPRRKIMEYFKPGDERGPLGYLRSLGSAPTGEVSSSFFAVWRPTSLEAIRMMMDGTATGKGLNVKGKSAKQGCLSGFVPFLQISEAQHKRMVGTSPKGAVIRLYFRTQALRDAAEAALTPILFEMLAGALAAEAAMARERVTGQQLPDAEREVHLGRLLWAIEDDAAELLPTDEIGWGLEMPERLFIEAYIT